MQNFERRHPRLLKKDEELQKLFDEAAKRRKQILVGQIKSSEIPIENDLQSQKYLLKPLRSTEDLKRERKILSSSKILLNNESNSRNAYQSCQNLPETNLDAFMEAGDSIPSKPTQEVIFLKHADTMKEPSQHSSFCELHQSRQGHHNSSYISTSISSSSTSSVEIDSNKYCQFFPINARVNRLISLSPTNSSKFKQISSFDDGMLLTQTSSAQSPERSNDSPRCMDESNKQNKNFKRESIYDKSKKRPSSVYYYPSGSPLLSNKYQGSPVVRIDEKIRAGDADYLLNCCYECDATSTPYYPGDCIHTSNNKQLHQQPHSSVILSRKPPIPSITFNKNISNDTHPTNPSRISSIDPSTGCIVSNKPPLLPHKFLSSQHHPPRVKMKLISAIHSQMVTSNNYNMNNSTSQPTLLLRSPVPPSRNTNQTDNAPKSSIQTVSTNNNNVSYQKPEIVDGGNITASTSTLIKRRKKKLLEEHLNKRFSMGDYSTRALIEWDSKLLLEMESEQENQCVGPHNDLYSSGDLDNCQHLKLKESMHSDYLYRVSSYSTKNIIDNAPNKTKDTKSTRLHTNSESSIIYCNQCHDITSSNSHHRHRNIASSSADSILVNNGTSTTANKNNNNPNSSQQHHQVSFCLRTKSADDDDDEDNDAESGDVNARSHHFLRHHKRQRSVSNFLQRSLYDFREAFRKRNNSSSTNSPFPVSSSSHDKMNSSSGLNNGRGRSGFQFKSLKKRQDSITSDQLYSIPPFVRKMPPLSSNFSTTNTKPSTTLESPIPIVSSLSSSNTTQSSSSSSHPSHNFITQLDPTYNHKSTNIDNVNNHNNEFKRNRSYRCSFIENPDVSTARKLANHDSLNPPNDSSTNNKKSHNHQNKNGSSNKSDSDEIAVSPPRYVVQPQRRIVTPKSIGSNSISRSHRSRQNTNLLYHNQKSGGGLGTPNSSKVNCAQQ